MLSPDIARGQIKHILWIDDDDGEFLETFTSLLEALPAKVSVIATGNEAVDFLLDSTRVDDPVHLIILDMRVPKSKGEGDDHELGMKLLIDMNRQYNLLPDSVPIIVFTAYGDFDHCIHCIRAGADHYLTKADMISGADNSEKLFRRCQSLLYPPPSERPKLLRWFDQYLPQLGPTLQGRVFSVVDAEIAQKLNVAGDRYGDYVVMIADDFEDLRTRILKDKNLRWLTPEIITLDELR